MALYSRHSVGLTTIYSDLKRRASEQTRLLVGTPGSVGERLVNGHAFLYRQYYDPYGKKVADYLGSAGDPEARARADAVREVIETTNGLLADARLLGRQGYVRVESRANAVLSALANHGLFRGGAVLVGSHAYGALLNDLGIKAAAHLTEDVDVARPDRLKIAHASFAKMLEDSGIPLSPILGFDRKAHPTSYKAPGRDRLRVDLLVPTSGREVKVLPVPELDAHATALPYLDYLLGDPIEAIVLGRDAVVPVKVPSPERFVLHKLLVSQLRSTTSEKRPKDLQQATVLATALLESDAGALAEAKDALPKSARTHVSRAAKMASLDV